MTMTRYKITAQIDPKAENTDGYDIHDYFDIDLHEGYGTPEQAQEAAKVAYKGPDADGVGCVWTIVPERTSRLIDLDTAKYADIIAAAESHGYRRSTEAIEREADEGSIGQYGVTLDEACFYLERNGLVFRSGKSPWA